MMKHLAYILSLLLIILCSCSEESAPGTTGAELPDGTPIEIEAAAEFPDIAVGATSRAMGDQPTAAELFNSLKVNILVFDGAGVMLQYIPPSDISITRIDEDNHKVYFKVRNIYSSTQPRRLHFVVTSVEDIRTLEGGDYITAMANETTVMPALMSKGNTDVYWGLSELSEITSGMSLEMRVIRNFVKLSVKCTDPDFRITGYTVVNRPGKGTVAPYIYKDHKFASFLSGGALVSYGDIIAQGYKGVNPAGAEESMTHTTLADVQTSLAESESSGGDSPYYFYERSQSEIAEAGSGAAVTYIIVKGVLNGRTYYYKIDIGHDQTGKFRFYDLLRNFHYTIDITEVGGPGAATLEDAMKGEVHNNISASVVMHDLFAISYNNELIVVSDTRVIFTEKTTGYKLRFRYSVPDGAGYTFDASQLKVYDLGDESKEYDMTGLPKTIDLGGNVIESATLSKDDGDWYVLNINTKDIPTDARRLEQNIRVYYTGGTVNLGRSVTLMLRQPWYLSAVSSTTPAADRESELEVNLTIPPGLVSTQFPLILTFESDKQNIYAMKGTDLTVAVDKSGFKGGTTDNVILYELSIPWSAYDSATGTAVTATFLTNTTSAEDRAYVTSGIDAQTNGSATNSRSSNNGSSNFCIRIANKGMKCIEPYYVNIARN